MKLLNAGDKVILAEYSQQFDLMRSSTHSVSEVDDGWAIVYVPGKERGYRYDRRTLVREDRCDPRCYRNDEELGIAMRTLRIYWLLLRAIQYGKSLGPESLTVDDIIKAAEILKVDMYGEVWEDVVLDKETGVWKLKE